MGMQINTNLAANNAYRSLSNTQNDVSKSLEKLSSGLRINRASDDAAGMALSEGMKSQIGGLTVASRNAQDGIGLIQTAEGGLSQAHSILQRLRDLGVQAANDTNNTESRTAIGKEAGLLVKELDRIGESTDFNGTKVLNGSVTTPLNFQVGASTAASSQITVDVSTANVSTVASSLNFGTSAVANNTVTGAIALTNDIQFTQGSTTVQVALDATMDTNTKLAAAMNADKGFAKNFSATVDDTDKLVITSKTPDAGVIGINQDTTLAGAFADAVVSTAATTKLGFTTAAEARTAIDSIDTQLAYVTAARSNLGATQNRLESAVQTINVAKENLTASNSRIRDTDMAEEMVKFTRNNILSQAGTAMLAQANQSSQGVLQLLR
jgi:flagellin